MAKYVDTKLITSDGSPIYRVPATPRQSGGMRPMAALAGGVSSPFSYDSDDVFTPGLDGWYPLVRSPDTEINYYRDRRVGRTRDLVRNDAWAAGAVTSILDSTIGGHYQLFPQPNHHFLKHMYGPGFDEVWADEFADAARVLWDDYANDINRYCDVSEMLTMTQQFRLAMRHRLVDGENTSLTYWLPERVGSGTARYATAFLPVDPDRLSNPMQMVDTAHRRGGVEINDNGVPLGYHFRKRHQNDWYNAVESMEWEYVPRQDKTGYRRVFHGFDHERAGQNRGVSIFTPVLSRMRALAQYYGVELQAATIASVFGTYVTSPFDQEMVNDALTGDQGNGGFSWYQGFRKEWHDARPISLANAKVATLAPGEDIKSVSSAHPNREFSPFAHEMLRSLAAVLGVSAEQITKDYSETNYSSARAAIVEAEKTFNRRMKDFATDTATPVYATWLEEPVAYGMLPMPRNAPAYPEIRTPLSRCRWQSPGRGWVDPEKERRGVLLGLQGDLSTLEIEVARNEGGDWRDNLRQKAREAKERERLGLPPASYSVTGAPAVEAQEIEDQDKNSTEKGPKS